MTAVDDRVASRIDQMRVLLRSGGGGHWIQAAMLGQAVVSDTIGPRHPIAATLRGALERNEMYQCEAAANAVLTLYADGGLTSPRLEIAGEIEGEILGIAQAQVELAESTGNASQKTYRLAIASFLAGAALEDALRRLCEESDIDYDVGKTTISKLKSLLYAPKSGVEVITRSESKLIDTWGDARNKADHGEFEDILHSEVLSMVIGVRSFVERHLTA